jgi:transcriptional regulator with XRE-family HTH domain
MLTGKELGAAIESARIAKGVSKKKLAEDFGVKPPSVQGWVNTGRINKSALMRLMDYFSDVVGPEHWGLSAQMSSFISQQGVDLANQEPESPRTPHEDDYYNVELSPAYDRVALGRALFDKATPRSQAIISRINALEAQGKLTDEDLQLLERIIERFSTSK